MAGLLHKAARGYLLFCPWKAEAKVPEIIDLRSDTLTRPTPSMRAAMAQAEVGDDVFGEDPTVNRLQERFARLAGKEAALFVSSGTQANQIALKCHTSPGQEMLCDANSHIVNYECGAPALLSGLSIRSFPANRGIFDTQTLRKALLPADIHRPKPALLTLENTHNMGGGTVWPLQGMREVTQAAREAGLATHLDGARLFNAVVATGVSLSTWASCVDSVSVCFSKGLGAPVGSILAGSLEFIERARRFRKLLGGGMRQVGILAAAAEYALDHHVERLAEDHANARLFARELAGSPAFTVEGEPPTNMVFCSLQAPPEEADHLVERCREQGVLFLHIGQGRFRAVTHLDVSAEQVKRAAKIIRQAAHE